MAPMQEEVKQYCKPISTSLLKLSSSMSPSREAKRMKISQVPYALAVGSLTYVMIYTRPNIAQAL